jgi:hypothetical protein
LLVVSVVDIHLLLDLALKSVLQRLGVSIPQCFGWVVLFQQKTKLSVNVIPKWGCLLLNTINWIECHIDIDFAKCNVFHCNKICSFGRPAKRWGASFGFLGGCLVMGRAWRGASLLLIAAHGDCKGNGARGMGQRRSHCNRSCGCGGRRARAWAWAFYSLCFIRNISECPNGGPIKGVTYLVDYFD